MPVAINLVKFIIFIAKDTHVEFVSSYCRYFLRGYFCSYITLTDNEPY